jgi:hypothetical protein
LIRGFQLRDAADLRLLRANELVLAELPVRRSTRQLVLSALSSRMPFPGRDHRAFVLEEDRGIQAILQSSARSNRDEWQVDYLASYYPFSVAYDLLVIENWRTLVQHASWSAAASGAQRLYARVPENTVERSVFMDAGFHAYSREHFFVFDERPGPVDLPSLPVRPQTKQDSWAIQQLYNATTPSFVRQVVPTSSKRWELPSYFPSRQSRAAGYVVEGADGVDGYIRREMISGQCMVGILFRPEIRHDLRGVIGTVLAEFDISKRSPIYFRLCDHQLELRTVVEELGASFCGAQVLLVRHTLGVIKVSEKQRLPAITGTPRVAPSSGMGHGGG